MVACANRPRRSFSMRAPTDSAKRWRLESRGAVGWYTCRRKRRRDRSSASQGQYFRTFVLGCFCWISSSTARTAPSGRYATRSDCPHEPSISPGRASDTRRTGSMSDFVSTARTAPKPPDELATRTSLRPSPAGARSPDVTCYESSRPVLSRPVYRCGLSQPSGLRAWTQSHVLPIVLLSSAT